MSGAAGLVDTLEALGVSLTVTAGGRLAVEPASAVPLELLERLKAEREEVKAWLDTRVGGRGKTPETPETPETLTHTAENARCFPGVSLQQTPETPGPLPVLPEALVRLIRAAAVNALNRPGFLPSGIVPNLGDYVLTCAALYACGFDPERQLADLWAARGAWAA